MNKQRNNPTKYVKRSVEFTWQPIVFEILGVELWFRKQKEQTVNSIFISSS